MQELTQSKLRDIFRAVLNLAPDVVDGASQASLGSWDSLAHALLTAAMESEFGLQIDAADSLDLTSFEAAAKYLERQGL